MRMGLTCWIRILLLFGCSGIACSISVLNITSVSMYWDDHIVVCTNSTNSTDSSYRLITRLGDLTLENSTSVLKDTTGNETCLISGNKYQLDGFYELSVTAIESVENGTLEAVGETTWENIFPNEHPIIRVIATTSFLFTNWHITDKRYDIDGYNLTLRTPDTSRTISLPNGQAAYTFRNPRLGKQSVCITAIIGLSAFQSNTYCSDIVDIKNNGVSAIPSPVKDMKTMVTSSNSLFVKWYHPDEENQEIDLLFVVTWSRNTEHKTVNQEEAYPFLEDDFCCDIQFVAKEVSSIEIKNLASNSNYTVCVLPVTNNIARGSTCDTVTFDDFQPLDPPQEFKYNPATSGRVSVERAAAEHKAQKPKQAYLSWYEFESDGSFWVEWHRALDGKTGHKEVTGNKLELEPLSGNLTFSIRALKGNIASKETFTNASVSGLIIHCKQVSTNSLSVSWDQWPFPLVAVHYNVSLKLGEKVLALSEPINCVGNDSACSYQFNNLKIPLPSMVTALVQNDDDTYIEAENTIIEAIGEIPSLTQDESMTDEVRVLWSEATNTNMYLLSVYPDKNLTVLRFRTVVTLPTRFTLPLKALDGNVVLVQPCKRLARCGNPSRLTVSTKKPPTKVPTSPVAAVSLALLIPSFAIVAFVAGKKVRNHYGDSLDSDSESEPLVVVNQAWLNYRTCNDRQQGRTSARGKRYENRSRRLKKGEGLLREDVVV